MHSLSILVGHFMRSEELKETMTQTEHHHLFSNISDILTVSTRQVGLGAGTRQAWEGIPSCSFVVQNQPSLGLLKVLPGRWGANALRDGAGQAVSMWESSRRRMQQPWEWLWGRSGLVASPWENLMEGGGGGGILCRNGGSLCLWGRRGCPRCWSCPARRDPGPISSGKTGEKLQWEHSVCPALASHVVRLFKFSPQLL